jgi:hypothetical protein
MKDKKVESNTDSGRLVYLLCGMALTVHLASNYLGALVARNQRSMGFV